MSGIFIISNGCIMSNDSLPNDSGPSNPIGGRWLRSGAPSPGMPKSSRLSNIPPRAKRGRETSVPAAAPTGGNAIFISCIRESSRAGRACLIASWAIFPSPRPPAITGAEMILMTSSGAARGPYSSRNRMSGLINGTMSLSMSESDCVLRRIRSSEGVSCDTFMPDVARPTAS